jgi:hypothetical protein
MGCYESSITSLFDHYLHAMNLQYYQWNDLAIGGGGGILYLPPDES